MPLRSNHILRELNADELTFLRSGGADVDLLAGATVQEAGRPIEYVYFPQSGSISFLVISKAGAFTEAGFVGADGSAGSLYDPTIKLHFTRAVLVVLAARCACKLDASKASSRALPTSTE